MVTMNKITINQSEYDKLVRAQKKAVQIFLFLKLHGVNGDEFTTMGASDIAKASSTKLSTLGENLLGLKLTGLIDYRKDTKNKYSIKLTEATASA